MFQINPSGILVDHPVLGGELFFSKQEQASHFDQMFALDEANYSRYRFHLATHNQRVALHVAAGEVLTIQQYIAGRTNMTKANLMTFNGNANEGQLWGLTYIMDQEYVSEMTLYNVGTNRWGGTFDVLFSDNFVRHYLTLAGSHIHFLETVQNSTNTGEYSLVGQRWAA